jgi:uridine phosphorylase
MADGGAQKGRRANSPKKKPRRARSTTATSRFPILEFDPAAQSVIEPSRILKPREVPEHCVMCFFQDVIAEICLKDGRVVAVSKSEFGTHPMYEIEFAGRRLAVVHPGVGAPLAAAILEEAIAFGCRKFIACGGAGVLDAGVMVGHVMVPTSAVRDEGTSYHYLRPSREVAASPRAVAAIQHALIRNDRKFLLGKTWTTDAIYRETRAKIDRRKREGCLTVEMEAAAFFAVAKFRGVEFGQILYAGDDLSGEWNHRDWTKHEIRERLFHLAAEACLEL